MAELQVSYPLYTEAGEYNLDKKFLLKRASFFDAGQDSYTIPPAQNPDFFERLWNVLPTTVQGSLQRRWGYQLWSSDATVIRRMYEFQQQSGATRRIIGTAGDGTGSASITNRVVAYNEDGTVFLSPIFTPSSSAISPRMAASRDFAYFVDNIQADLQKWNGTFLATYTLSAVANTSGGNTVYTGTGLGGITSGTQLIIAGFTNPVNNGTFTASASTSTTVTVNNEEGVAQTQAATATVLGLTNIGIVAPSTAPVINPILGGGSQSFALTSVANASGGNTVYTGTGLSAINPGTSVQIFGFTNGVNNGTFLVSASTATTITVNNANGIAETTNATATTQNSFYPTVFLNGWGPNGHVGSYEGGINQGYYFGTDGGTTAAYSNPGNAIDGNNTTFASSSQQHTHTYAGCVWKFGTPSVGITNPILNILSEVPANGTDGQIVTARSAGVWYSLDNGTTWVKVYDTPNRAQRWDTITLPVGQDISKVHVMAFLDAHDDMYHKVYEINIQATAVGSGPITLSKGRTYFIAFENSSSGGFSDVSPASPNTGAVSGASIPLSNLAVSTDPQVDRKVLLATADGGNTQTLFLLANLPNSSTTHTDTTPELTLLAANVYGFIDAAGNQFGVFGNKPPQNGQFLTKHRGRMYMLVGQQLAFSKNLAEVTTPTTTIAGRFEECWPAQNQFDISVGAEVGRCLLSDGDFLYVGTDRHVYRIIGDGPENFQPPQTAFNEGGVLNQECWRSVFIDGSPLGVMWITPDYRVYISDFNTHRDVGIPIQDVLNSINPAANANVYAQYYALGAYNLYVLALPTGSNTDLDTLCIYDLKAHKWFIWFPTDKVTSLLYNINASGIPQIIFWSSAAAASRGYKFVPGLVQDRVSNGPLNFTCTMRTSWLDLSDVVLRKVLNWIQINSEDTALTMTVEGASTALQFTTPNTVIASGSFKTSPFGDLTMYVAGQKSRDRYYRFTIQSAGQFTTFVRAFSVRGFGWHTF